MKPNTYSSESRQRHGILCIVFVASGLIDLGTQVLRSIPKSLVTSQDLDLGLLLRLTTKANCSEFHNLKEMVNCNESNIERKKFSRY